MRETAVVRAENKVIDGIRRTSCALRDGTVRICRNCRDAVREFSLYRWDESGAKDSPVKENDHAMDDIRYFVSDVMGEDDGFFAVTVNRGEVNEYF